MGECSPETFRTIVVKPGVLWYMWFYEQQHLCHLKFHNRPNLGQTRQLIDLLNETGSLGEGNGVIP